MILVQTFRGMVYDLSVYRKLRGLYWPASLALAMSLVSGILPKGAIPRLKDVQ